MEKINFQDYPNTTTPVNATNLNQLQTNIENMTLSGTGYVKFDDGTMICYGEVTGTSTLYTYYDYFKRTEEEITFNFPQTFISAPNVVITVKAGYAQVTANSGASTTTTGSFTVFKPASATDTNYAIKYMAIGKWK